MSYTITQLDEMIRLARQLGFWDDVDHWESEKAKLTRSGEPAQTND